jgi:hypothetical protein
LVAAHDERDELDDDESTRVLSTWQYLGSGYRNPGDALLAAASKPHCGPPERHCSTCGPDRQAELLASRWQLLGL